MLHFRRTTERKEMTVIIDLLVLLFVGINCYFNVKKYYEDKKK